MSVVSQPETTASSPRAATRPDPARRAVLISLNPRAGSRSCHARVRAIGDSLAAAGFELRTTSELGELASMAEEGLQGGTLRAVLAVGGDGTASVVRNHVPLSVPIVPVPMGTENLLGRYVGQAIAPDDVCRTVAEGVEVGLDLGRANGKHFLLMISIGFDAEVVRSLHENRRGNIRRTAYFFPALRAMRRYNYPPLQLYSKTADAAEEPLACRWLFGFNLPLYALGLPIAPEAIATDGLLDVCTFQRGTAWSVLRYLWHVRRGAHLNLTDAAMLRSGRFRVESAGSPNIAYQLDGDFGGTLPVNVEVLPGQLRMLVSPAAATRLGFRLPNGK